MSYVKDNLMSNEKILFTAYVHPAVFLPAFVTFVVTLMLFIYGFSKAAVITTPGSAPPQATPENIVGGMLILVSIFLFLYSIFLTFQALIVKSQTEFAVTNRRVIAKTGFIRRHTLEMLLPKIESVSVHQNVLGRLLNFGTVTVTGTGGTKESFRAIIEPIGVRKKINQIIEAYMQYQRKLATKQTSDNEVL